jgi:hypothetical protein
MNLHPGYPQSVHEAILPFDLCLNDRAILVRNSSGFRGKHIHLSISSDEIYPQTGYVPGH